MTKMKILFYIGLLISLLTGCSNSVKTNSKITNTGNQTNDIIIGRKPIKDEIAGSAFRKRATKYFVIKGNVTSKFACIFVELKDSGKVSIDLNLPYFKTGVTYRQVMNELQMILPVAGKDYNFDSLRSIYIGRLVQIGDAAIEVTKQYAAKFGQPQKITDYRKVETFLKVSKLGEDFSKLLDPYAFDVENVATEKLIFTSKKELLYMSKVEIDTTEIPEKIMDCMTRIILKRK
jgi:hypothetical protein